MRSRRPTLLLVGAIVALAVLALVRSGEIRARAEQALGRGMPAREAALARGFVLGQDEGVDPSTEEAFRRAGLSHLLAVSGQNVVLLALLATPVLAALGIPSRERLLWLLALIAVYVPVAGAGPSIQRAALMGAASLVAALAGRRASRLYGLALAGLVTLAISPSVAADVGWQLSFAAVIGIFVLAAPLREAVLSRIGNGHSRRAIAEGAAITAAATLATAPLIAFHFQRLSTTTLLANLLAMPAVAPAMWLGMLSAAAAQVPGLPVEPINALCAPLLAYIAEVAAWCARPDWAELRVDIGAAGLALAYASLGAALLVAHRLGRALRLRRLRLASVAGRGPWRGNGSASSGRAWRGLGLPALVVALLLVGTLAPDAWLRPLAGSGGDDCGSSPPPRGELRIVVLDVGQGDAILLQPAGAATVLVDGGPPGNGLAAKLAEAGVERLGAVVVSHAESDHVGGVEDLLGAFPVNRLLYGRLSRRALSIAQAAGARTVRVARGATLRSGRLRVEFLWPPPELLDDPPLGADPNQLALVAVASWGDFTMLLSADAEAEAVPLDPGPVDVLKVAHHGSEDAGLAGLLERTRPRLALISVGAGNPYGHPAATTLATLAAHGVRSLRTDLQGRIEIHASDGKVTVGDRCDLGSRSGRGHTGLAFRGVRLDG